MWVLSKDPAVDVFDYLVKEISGKMFGARSIAGEAIAMAFSHFLEENSVYQDAKDGSGLLEMALGLDENVTLRVGYSRFLELTNGIPMATGPSDEGGKKVIEALSRRDRKLPMVDGVLRVDVACCISPACACVRARVSGPFRK
jgi:hypothetical protein